MLIEDGEVMKEKRLSILTIVEAVGNRTHQVALFLLKTYSAFRETSSS